MHLIYQRTRTFMLLMIQFRWDYCLFKAFMKKSLVALITIFFLTKYVYQIPAGWEIEQPIPWAKVFPTCKLRIMKRQSFQLINREDLFWFNLITYPESSLYVRLQNSIGDYWVYHQSPCGTVCGSPLKSACLSSSPPSSLAILWWVNVQWW